jgi:type IV pilus assembly protein PilM
MFLIPKKIVGLDFHDYFAQAIEVKSYGKNPILTAFNRVAIPPNVMKDGEILNKDELKKILSVFLETANPEAIKSKKVVCTFPAKKVFTHIFTFPAALSEREIKKAIPFEAETVIPFSIQDVYWDFRVLYKDDVNKKHASQTVLFACVPKAVADSYTDLLMSMGLTPLAFTIPAECAEYALRKQLPKDKDSFVIDVGSLVTTFSIFEKGILKNSFMSLDGGKSLILNMSKKYQVSEAELIDQKEKGSFDKIYLPEVKSFIRNTLSEGQRFLGKADVSDIFITGEFLNLPDFYETAKKTFPNQTVSFGDPRIGLDIDYDKFLPLDKKTGTIPYSIYFTEAIGLALKGLGQKLADGMNLLPDKLRESFASRKTSVLIGLSVVLMTILSLSAATFVSLKRQELNYKRFNVEAKKESLQQMVFGTRYQEIKTAISNFNNEVAALSNIENVLFSFPALLDDITSNISDGVHLLSINFVDSDLSIEMSGVAETRESLLKTQENLEKAPFVEELIAPLSNFDTKTDISFVMKIELKFNELKKYGSKS